MTSSSYAPRAQVTATHYAWGTYVTRGRWSSYWHQIDEVLTLGPASCLVVGTGDGIVGDLLRRAGVGVTTVDAAQDLGADLVCDVRSLHVGDAAFDVVLCAQVLEHIPRADVGRALDEIARVARLGAVISVPQYGRSWQVAVRLPLLPELRAAGTLPARTRHRPDRQHEWELGARNHPRREFERELAARFPATRTFAVPDHPYHRFYACRCTGERV